MNEETERIGEMVKSGRPTLTIDVAEFKHHLEESNATQAEKEEFLQTMWEIIVQFAFLGFGIHPVEQAQETCGKEKRSTSIPTQADSLAVESTHEALIHSFVRACDKEVKGDKADA